MSAKADYKSLSLGTIVSERSSKSLDLRSVQLFARVSLMPTIKGFPCLLSRVLLAVFGLVLALVLIGYAVNFQTRKRAEHFIRGLQTLKVGTSTTQDTMRIVARYGGWEMNLNADPHDVAPWGIGPCAGPHPRFGMRVAPDLVNRSVYSVPLLRYLGLHIWGVAGTVDVKDGKVLCILQNVGFGRSDGHDITVQAQMVPEFSPSDEFETYEVRSHFIRHHIHELVASVLPTASNQEKSRAFRVELACATSFGGCFYACQLAPLAWNDLSQ
jgi:hypothetical protein